MRVQSFPAPKLNRTASGFYEQQQGDFAFREKIYADYEDYLAGHPPDLS
jgi:hypothetical protein